MTVSKPGHMRLKTIFIIVITILLTIVIMQNNSPTTFRVLFFSTYTSKLMIMFWTAVVAFIIGYLVGRPKTQKLGNDYGHGYDEGDNHTQHGSTSTLSDEDRDYINGD